jgi:hypothetical protein
MSNPDKVVIIIMLLLITIHLGVAVAGFITGRLLFLMTLLNLIAGLSIIIYWIQKQLRISQHIFEGREVLGLILELIVVGCGMYVLSKNHAVNFFKVLQYIFFSIHLLLLILALIFMLTFKMNKLI